MADLPSLQKGRPSNPLLQTIADKQIHTPDRP